MHVTVQDTLLRSKHLHERSTWVAEDNQVLCCAVWCSVVAVCTAAVVTFVWQVSGIPPGQALDHYADSCC
jgi:hypothetical protein